MSDGCGRFALAVAVVIAVVSTSDFSRAPAEPAGRAASDSMTNDSWIGATRIRANL
jgi:hypothetical protein